jgi:hypothetical protein
MLDPSILDPNVFQAAQKAGLDHVEDCNHNGKLDIQDVALMQLNVPIVQPEVQAVV